MSEPLQLRRTHAAKDGAELWAEELAWIKRVIAAITPKEAYALLDCSPSYLDAALDERERNRVPAKWVPRLLAASPEHLRREYLELVAGACCYRVERVRPLTAEEELSETRQMIARYAPLVLEKIDAELGQRRAAPREEVPNTK